VIQFLFSSPLLSWSLSFVIRCFVGAGRVISKRFAIHDRKRRKPIGPRYEILYGIMQISRYGYEDVSDLIVRNDQLELCCAILIQANKGSRGCHPACPGSTEWEPIAALTQVHLTSYGPSKTE
jgi:hypothetical protein